MLPFTAGDFGKNAIRGVDIVYAFKPEKSLPTASTTWNGGSMFGIQAKEPPYCFYYYLPMRDCKPPYLFFFLPPLLCFFPKYIKPPPTHSVCIWREIQKPPYLPTYYLLPPSFFLLSLSIF